MSRMNRGSVRKALATFVALILSTFGLAGVAAANTIPEPNAVNYGNIDTDARGSITVHKHLHQTGETTVTGDVNNPTDIPSDPVAGVEFTAYPVLQDGSALDLTNPASWDGLADLMPAGGECAAPEGYTLGTGQVFADTDANGEATLDNLPIGAYVVCETNAPEEIVETAQPFIVTIPFPYSDGWIYDVHAYPKNSAADAPTKTIEAQEGFVAGAEVKFPVTVNVPTLDSDASYESFVVRDTLDTRLTPAEPAVEGDLHGGTLAVDGQDVTVTFTADQFRALAGQTITLTFVGVVNADIGDGEIENTALVNINGSDFESNTVKTNWGDLIVRKVNSSDPGATLEGAVFDLYVADIPENGTCDTATPAGDPIATDLTTDADGQLRVSALFVSDSETAPVNASTRCYVLVETQAPAGFVTPEGADAQFPVQVTIGQTAGVDLTVDNVQQDVPELPLTGSAGTLILTAIGLLLVAIAVTMLIINRRKTASITQ